MEIDYSKIFHQSSKDGAKGHPPIPKNDSEWPEEWKTIYYKTYPRLPKIALSRFHPDGKNFYELIKGRSSLRDFQKRGMSLDELSHLLEFSCGITTREEKQKRVHPSGGARYPIEIYPLVIRNGVDINAGIYHYNIDEHSLDILPQSVNEENLDHYFLYEWVKQSSVVLLLTAVFSRSQMKYGERGYRYILLEAGHIGQNIYLTSEALGLKCCALGGTIDTKIEQELLDIDGSHESIVYALVVGK